MRKLACIIGIIAAGCSQPNGNSVGSSVSPTQSPPTQPVVTQTQRPVAAPALTWISKPLPPHPHRWQPNPNDPDPVVNEPPSDNVPDLRSRKTGSDWPFFLGPTGDSVSSEKGIITPWPQEGLRIVWTVATGTGYGMPTISRGRLFLFDYVDGKNRLRCLKSETGEPLWQFAYPTDFEDMLGYDPGPRCSPIVEGGRVYLYGPEGMLHCLAVTDGQVIWKVDTRAQFGVVPNFFGVGSTPVIEGDLLLAQVGGSPPGSPGIMTGQLRATNDTAVVAFDKRTGKVKWWCGDELASYASPKLATIHGRRWCFVFARGGLLGLDPATGQIDFHYPWRSRHLASVNASNPVVVGDQVLISECYSIGSSLLQVKPGAYAVLWKDEEDSRRKNLATHWMTPIHHAGYVYGCSGRYENGCDLRCIELATGKLMWSNRGLWRSSLLLVDGHFICLDEQGEVVLLKVNPEKYEEVSRLALNKGEQALLKYPCWAAPILAQGLLYLRGKDRLVCLELIPAQR